MTDNPKFSPERSAAIRRLLIENVEAEPRRRTSHLRALLTGLIITGIVASGSTALALNRDSLFGAPTPLASTSIAHSPAASATASAQPMPVATGPSPVPVATSPILRTDVDSVPTSPGWSLPVAELGNPAEGAAILSISQDYSLISVSPEEGARLSDDADAALSSSFSLTLVNTRTGEQVWSRDWTWDLEPGVTSSQTRPLVLGSSGRVLVMTTGSENGPREVIDLTNGTDSASFQPAGPGEVLDRVYVPPGDSGDVYALFAQRDDQGTTLPYFVIRRFDPLQTDNVRWSTRVDATDLYIEGDHGNGLAYAKVTYYTSGYVADGTQSLNGVLDLTTGEFSPRPEPFIYHHFTGYAVRTTGGAAGSPTTLTGLDDDGNSLWTRTEVGVHQLVEVLTSATAPVTAGSAMVGNGDFVFVSADGVTLVEGSSGATLWHVALADVKLEQPSEVIRLEARGDSMTLTSFGGRGTSSIIDLKTGAWLGDSPWNINYDTSGDAYAYRLADGQLSAIDKTTGEVVWTTASSADYVYFAGGHLVAVEGRTLTSVG